MWASDYPHSVTTWPNSRQYIEKQMNGVAPDARAKLLANNAVELYALGRNLVAAQALVCQRDFERLD